jgi:hypothetical protein
MIPTRWLALPALLLLLSGCATSPAVDRSLTVSDATRSEVRRLVEHDLASNGVNYRLSIAGADDCRDAGLQHRSPFSLLFNATALPSAEMRTAIFQLYGLEHQARLQAHTPELAAYDGARVVAVNGESTANPGKAMGSLFRALDKQRPLTLRLEDGRSVEAQPQRACPGIISGDYTGIAKAPENFGGIVELVPTAWAKVVRTPDELAFVLARSVYFTGAEGQHKLRHALYAGAAVSGVLRALTFGVAQLVADPKRLAVQARRRLNRQEADAFALRLMRRAGFDVHAAVAFARRSIEEGAIWPEECDELRFDQERLAALQKLI